MVVEAEGASARRRVGVGVSGMTILFCRRARRRAALAHTQQTHAVHRGAHRNPT